MYQIWHISSNSSILLYSRCILHLNWRNIFFQYRKVFDMYFSWFCTYYHIKWSQKPEVVFLLTKKAKLLLWANDINDRNAKETIKKIIHNHNAWFTSIISPEGLGDEKKSKFGKNKNPCYSNGCMFSNWYVSQVITWHSFNYQII